MRLATIAGRAYSRDVDIAEVIAERKIREALEQGAFDGLDGAGRPIDDLDRRREPGWWAARTVAEERRRAEGD